MLKTPFCSFAHNLEMVLLLPPAKAVILFSEIAAFEDFIGGEFGDLTVTQLNDLLLPYIDDSEDL